MIIALNKTIINNTNFEVSWLILALETVTWGVINWAFLERQKTPYLQLLVLLRLFNSSVKISAAFLSSKTTIICTT